MINNSFLFTLRFIILNFIPLLTALLFSLRKRNKINYKYDQEQLPLLEPLKKLAIDNVAYTGAFRLPNLRLSGALLVFPGTRFCGRKQEIGVDVVFTRLSAFFADDARVSQEWPLFSLFPGQEKTGLIML